jgi:hypothetical protein
MHSWNRFSLYSISGTLRQVFYVGLKRGSILLQIMSLASSYDNDTVRRNYVKVHCGYESLIE